MARSSNRSKSGAGTKAANEAAGGINASARVKFEIHGEEMIDKKVMRSGASGRVYLPPNWVGRLVKIIRID